jgi:type IV secretion system protein VirB9
MKHLRILILLLAALLAFPLQSMAIQVSRPLPVDHRLHVITYHPDDIHKYTGFYDYEASMVLDEGEKVLTIAMGVTSGWMINPVGNRIFLKPISNDPAETNTNMLMITNKRIYHFILEAAEASGMDDPNLVWETKFVYADEDRAGLRQFPTSEGPDLNDPDKHYNFSYTISGSDQIAPLQIFDDGEFTYFKFPYKNADIPAFFLVDSDGHEALINYRVDGDYIVVERVGSQFTLRHGSSVTCVFNESHPLPKAQKKT